jgi:uncharacterized membrane protein YkvA (DUF1232 family)
MGSFPSVTNWLERARRRAHTIKRDVIALWIAARDARTPNAAKIVAGAAAAYALSPIDLIPDFVPLLGYLDDLLIVPLGILLAVKLVPAPLMMAFREEAARRQERPVSRGGVVVIVATWIVAAAMVAWWVWPKSAP